MGIHDLFRDTLTCQLGELPLPTFAQVGRLGFGQLTYGNSSKPFRKILPQDICFHQPIPTTLLLFMCLPGSPSFSIFQETLIEMSLQRRDAGFCRVTSVVNSRGSSAFPRRKARQQWQWWLLNHVRQGVLLYSGPASSEAFLCISSPPLLPPTRPPQSVGFCPSVLKSRRSLRLGTQPRPFSFPQKTWLRDDADLPLSFESSFPFPLALSLLHTSRCPEATTSCLLIELLFLPHPH